MLDAANWKPDDLLKALAFGGAVIAFTIGLLQYRKAQRWKRAEWVAQEMKALVSNPIIQAVLQLIDWSSRRVLLYPDREADQRYVVLRDAEVASALMAHESRPGGFTEQEAVIRSAFDEFLDAVERFNSYVETGLVTVSDLRPYLKYWADNICDQPNPNGTEERLRQLQAYMPKYGFGGAYKLLKAIAALPPS